MKKHIIALLVLTASAACAQDLSGRYTTPGDCIIRTSDNSYRKCKAANTLNLRRQSDGDYAYGVTANTFATTQGQCQLTGALHEIKHSGQTLLQAPKAPGVCQVTFRVDKKALTLISPNGDDNYYVVERACRPDSCTGNSSLYTQPFLLRTRRPLPANAPLVDE